MQKYEKFSVCGVGKELLTKVLENNKEFIENFEDINCFYTDSRGALVLCQCDEEDAKEHGYKIYPFQVTVGMLVEHILSRIDNTTEEELEKLGELPSGYEEDYTYGWRLFIPRGEYYCKDSKESNRDRIEHYDWYRTVLAVHAELVEYGK